MLLKELLQYAPYGLRHLQGPTDLKIESVRAPEQATRGSLVFVSKQDMVEKALSKGATAFVKTPELTSSFPAEVSVFEVPSISLGFALILPHFDQKLARFEHSQNISIHPSAKIGEGVKIGAFAVIGANTIIGQGCRIGAGTVIENNCVIGAKTILHPHVFIGAQTEVGTECEIHPHTTLGSDGFGYVTDPSNGRRHKVPQLGRVVIEDRVEIGSNCAIDRATLTETRIKAGTKLDNLVHIAHNVEIGEDSLITGNFSAAGSTKIGKRFVCGGQAGVGDHVTICDDVTIAGRTAVLFDITEPGTYGGMPVVKIQQYLRISKALTDLPDMWKFWKKQTK